MRAFQRRPLVRLGCALAAAALVSFAAWRTGTAAVVGLLIVSLTVIGYAALTAAPANIAYRRGHAWRWWWRSSDNKGPFWPGTRIPRSPSS